jgi:hypothetical protein
MVASVRIAVAGDDIGHFQLGSPHGSDAQKCSVVFGLV